MQWTLNVVAWIGPRSSMLVNAGQDVHDHKDLSLPRTT